MADRGSQIKEELLLHFCNLEVLPGVRMKSQMTSADVKEKHVAKIRVHVERAINCIKSFRILKNTLPVSLLQDVDDILWIYAALCNLKPKLICSKNEEDKSNV